MSAAPGWYDAGVPGRVRWWDGVQWTEHEAPAPAPVTYGAAAPAPAPADPAAAAPAPTPTHLTQVPTPRRPAGPPLGWYPTPAGPLRWWDGSAWTGFRVEDGVPGIDWATAERPAAAWTFGGLFAVLGLVQFALALVSPGPAVSGSLMLLLAVMWFAIAAKSSAVRRIPTPTGDPVVLDAVEPLPGVSEGPGAGWYPLTSTVTRWWTGARWSQYIGTVYGVRPTFHGARSWRKQLILLWAVLGLGVVAMVVGVVLAVVAGPGDDLLVVIGVMTAIGGVTIAGLAGLLFAFSGRQRRTLLVPETPPSGPPATAAR